MNSHSFNDNIEYPSTLTVAPLQAPLNATLSIPGSKSITNRAFILAALAKGPSILSGALFSEDTYFMSQAIRSLGIEVESDLETSKFVIQGCNGNIPSKAAEIFIGNSGTSARFLTAFVALGNGTFQIDGIQRMRERPIQDLIDPLNILGSNMVTLSPNGCPPVQIRAKGLQGGNVVVKGNISSQYLSALLMVAPYAKKSCKLVVDGELASRPYIDITIRMMREWGVEVEQEDENSFVVEAGQRYHSQSYTVEPDASGASYFYAAGALIGGSITVRDLNLASMQGDMQFVKVLEMMGCELIDHPSGLTIKSTGHLRGVDIDMNSISDTVMTLAAIAPFASSPTTISNVRNIRYKETDRLSAVATELTRIGVPVEEYEDGIKIYPVPEITPATVETYNDHRMAMSFSVLGLKSSGITINDPGCVAKTFPDFFKRLELLHA